jgi:hypothetical protein
MMTLWHVRMSLLGNYTAWERSAQRTAPAVSEPATLQGTAVSPDCAALRNELAADGMTLRIDGQHYHYVQNNGNELPVAHYAGHALAHGCFQKDGFLRIVQKTAGNQWGLSDAQGDVIVTPQFSRIHEFNAEGLAFVERENYIGRIDRSGKIVIPVRFSVIGAFDKNGFAKVERGLLYGYIDKNGKEVIPVRFECIGLLEEGLIHACQHGKEGYIDWQGKTVVPFAYDCLGPLEEGLMRACQNGKVGYIDQQGQTVIPFIYEDGQDFNHGMVWVRKTGQPEWSRINNQGEEVISPGQLAGLKFNAWGLALAEIYVFLQEQIFVYVNKTGHVVSPHHYRQIDEANRYGLRRVSAHVSDAAGLKWGWVNEKAEEVIPLRFDAAEGFAANGLAAVSVDGRWSYVNRHGRVLFPPRFAQARSFSHGLAAIAIETDNGDSRWGFIDQTGKVRIPLSFDYVEDFTSEGSAYVERRGKSFWIDTTGKFLREASPEDEEGC